LTVPADIQKEIHTMPLFTIGSEVWDVQSQKRGRVQGIDANGNGRVGWRDGGSDLRSPDLLTPMVNGVPVEDPNLKNG
jgi:hypothetical protein